MPFYFRLGKRSQQYNVANKDLFVIPIELLTNECIECTLLSTSIGQECLNNVCQKIGLQQPEYFCLLFKSKKNVDQWVDLNKPLKKQLDKYAIEVRLYFRLQYFVPNFHFLSDEISRYHYFCAMKGLVIDGRIACSRDDAILLASFSLQAEFGDYSPERHTVEYLNNFALFPKSMVTSKIARDVLVECAINAYRNLQGVPTNVAEIYYISEAQRREGYGQEGFPARDLDTGQDVCLGVCIRGIFVVNTDANTLELFKWMDIANLIHNKKVFTIERNVDKYSKNYSTYDSDYASCIWRTCVEQHQYFMKGIQTVHESEALNVDQTTMATNNMMPSVHFIQNQDLFPNSDNFAQHKASLNPGVDNVDYSQIQTVNSLYETINKVNLSKHNAPLTTSNIELSNNVQQQEYSVNGCVDKLNDQNILRTRSSTEPVDLHHITLTCGNNYSVKASEHNHDSINHSQTQSKASSNSPLANSNIPIYENQLNPSDLTVDQRKKLLPSYKNPPDYETFLKQKYSAMASLSQSLSSIPSRLASHNQINSSSSSSSLAHQSQAIYMNGNRNMTSSSSTISVPHLLQNQQKQPCFSGSIYKNYTDLSTIDIDKSSANALSQVNYRGSLAPNESHANSPFVSLGLNQLGFQKQQMQKSGMFTSSSPELNNLNLFQKRNAQLKSDLLQQSKLNGMARLPEHDEVSLKRNVHFPHHFTSVPDLTFKNSAQCVNHLSPEMNRDSKKFLNIKSKNFFPFGGKNLRIFRSQNNTGSEPNLFNNCSNNSPNCYNLQRYKLSTEHLNNIPQKRSNSVCMPEQPMRHPFSYSLSHKIDEVPELFQSEPMHQQPDSNGGLNLPSDNVYSPQHQRQPYQQSPQIIYVNVNTAPVPTSSNNPNENFSQLCHSSAQESNSKCADSSTNNIILTQTQSINHPNMVNDVYNSHVIKTPYSYDSSKQHSISNLPELKTTNSDVIIPGTSDNRINQSAVNVSQNMGIIKNSRIIVFDKSFDDQDFTREFELLPRMNPTAKFTTASLADNILKNRFRDILPYEENRVKLSSTKDNKHGYINASHVYMVFGSMKQHYIAAQGPLPNTTLDFWQMVFEQNINLIVMVTNFTESGSQKCYTYLPLSNEPGKNTVRFGDYEITCNYNSTSSTYISSFLTLSYNGQKRTLTHLRYTDWNDHSIPGDLQGFLSFLSEMDAIYRRNNREGSGFGKKRFSNHPPPILVHCSAGAGRSGVVILCDTLLKCLDHNFNEPIDIPRALIQLRFQRMISVQHCEQFRFVCQVLSQYLTNSRLI